MSTAVAAPITANEIWYGKSTEFYPFPTAKVMQEKTEVFTAKFQTVLEEKTRQRVRSHIAILVYNLNGMLEQWIEDMFHRRANPPTRWQRICEACFGNKLTRTRDVWGSCGHDKFGSLYKVWISTAANGSGNVMHIRSVRSHKDVEEAPIYEFLVKFFIERGYGRIRERVIFRSNGRYEICVYLGEGIAAGIESVTGSGIRHGDDEEITPVFGSGIRHIDEEITPATIVPDMRNVLEPEID